MLIQNGIVHPMDGAIIPNGFVEILDGKIKSVGSMSAMSTRGAAEHDIVVDAAGGHIVPGFVDAHCHLGMFGDALGFEADDGNECTDPCTPNLRAIDAVNPLDRCFMEARRGGVTTVHTGPGSANAICGQSVVLKTTGIMVEQMIVKAPAAMKFALGENPKTVYNERKETPMTRMATAAIIRETLAKAQEYIQKTEKAASDADADVPDFDAKLAALVPVLRGEVPAHIHCHRADDIATALRLCAEFHLTFVFVHGTEGHLLAQPLGELGAGIITGPCLTDRSKPELRGQRIENPAILAAAGARVAICTDHPETPIQYLPICAAMAVRGGMEIEAALAAITINAAVLAGVGARVGSLTVGKDADVVVTSAHPLDWLGKITCVVIDGAVVDLG